MTTIVRGNFHDIYFVYPLSQVYGDGLHVSLASLVVQPNYILAAAEDNLVLGATEQLGGHEVTGYDELSVTVTWQVSILFIINKIKKYNKINCKSMTSKTSFISKILNSIHYQFPLTALYKDTTWFYPL